MMVCVDEWLWGTNYNKSLYKISYSLHFNLRADSGPTIVVTLTEELQKAEEVTSELIISHHLLTYAKKGNMWEYIT